MPCLVLFKDKRFRKAAKEGNVDRLQHFFTNGADVNKPNKKGRTALIKASEQGHAKAALYLLTECEAQWELKDEQGLNALLHGVQGGHNDILTLLLEKKHQDIASIDRALVTCIKQGNKDGVELLLKGGGPNGTAPANPNSDSEPLIVAAEEGQQGIALLLLQYGAHVNPTRAVGTHAAIHYAIENKMGDLVKDLLQRQADVNLPGEKGRSPLTIAMEHFPDIVPVLMQYKPNVDTADDNGDTPLHRAARHHRTKEMAMLIDAGANVNAENNNKKTPLFRAIDDDTEEDVPEKHILATVQLLLQHKADPNQSTADGDNPLCCAIKYRYDSVAKALLKANANPDRIDYKKRSPLYIATKEHNNEMVKMLLDYHADPNPKGPSALCQAIRKGYQTIALALLDAGADVNRSDEEKNPPLALVFRGDEEVQKDVFHKLLDLGANVNQKDADKNTILYLAVKYGDNELVDSLLQRKADPNVNAASGDTCLGYAIRHNKPASIAHALLKANASVEVRDKHAETPLTNLLGAEKCDRDLLQAVLARGADVEALDSEGVTPLCMAVETWSVDVVEMLLAKGAKVNKSSKSGERPVQLALKRSDDAILRTLLAVSGIELDGMHLVLSAMQEKKRVFVTLLVNANVNIDETNSKNETPLGEALVQGDMATAKMLIEKNANVNNSDPRGSPLFLAVKADQVDLARVLVRRYADVNTSHKGSTPLGEAIKKSNLEMVQLLLQNNADADAPCSNGKRPLVLAAEKKAWSIVDALLERGARPDVIVGSSDASANKSRSASSSTSSAQPLIHLMCEQGRDAIVKRMIYADRNIVDAKNGKGLTPLQVLVASNKPNQAVLDTLLDANPNVNCVYPGTEGNSLLLMAIKKNKTGVVSALLNRGSIDVNYQRKDGKSALHVATDVNIVDRLLAKGASPRLADEKGNTALLTHITSKNPSVAKLLIRNIGDVSILKVKNKKSGNNALHYAAGQYADKSICRELVRAGLDPNIGNSSKNTALHQACHYGNISIVKYFIDECNVKYDKKNSSGLTPRDVAWKEGRTEVAEMLAQEGAETTLNSSFASDY